MVVSTSLLAERGTMEAKPIWASKTFWFNLLALIVAIASAFGFGVFEPSPEVKQVALGIVAIINIVLRFVTSKRVYVRKP